MNICKGCFHFPVCQAYGETNKEDCAAFTDRSEWVHLPCKEVYFICDKGTKFATVMSKSITDLCIHEIKEIDKSGYYFSTKGKAEKALEGKI